MSHNSLACGSQGQEGRELIGRGDFGGIMANLGLPQCNCEKAIKYSLFLSYLQRVPILFTVEELDLGSIAS